MPIIGELQTRFGRSYVWMNPDPSAGPATWRLTYEEETDDGGGNDAGINYSAATVRSDTPAIQANQLIYIDDFGRAGLANASVIETSRVAGVAVSAAVANGQVTYTRNQPVNITNTATVVDGAPDSLEPGRTYWLSAVNSGNYTRTPDTTTTGAVLVVVGMALSQNQFTIEIQGTGVI